MFPNNVLCVLIVVCWICLMGECGVVAPRQPFRSHTTGGYKNFQVTNNASEVDCSQFSDDYDILRQLPFPIVLNPTTHDDYKGSTAVMDKDDIFVIHIEINKENVVPPSIFCLSNLEKLLVRATSFENGIVPDTLANLKKLHTLLMYGSPIRQMTEQLGTLTNLSIIQFVNCSLTSLPNLSNLQQLIVFDAPINRLTHLDGIPGVRILDLDVNHLNKIPILTNPENLEMLSIIDNPLDSVIPILLYNNLAGIYLKNTTTTFIPPEIDKLQNLQYLDLSENYLAHLPSNLLNLPQLEYLNISTNLLSRNEIQSIQKAFKQSHPNLELFV